MKHSYGSHHRYLTLAGLAIAMTVAASCVGPSRTIHDYKRKVANSAEAVVSAIESALLTVQVADDGRAPAPYVSLRLSESEEAVASVESSLSAVQPPHHRSDDLRSEALALIGEASDVLQELRVASYRGELQRMPATAQRLAQPLAGLRRLMKSVAK